MRYETVDENGFGVMDALYFPFDGFTNASRNNSFQLQASSIATHSKDARFTVAVITCSQRWTEHWKAWG